MAALPLPGPDKGECQGRRDRCGASGCPLFGTLGREARDGLRRVRGCGDPVAVGRRNKSKGSRAMTRAKRIQGIAARANQEEDWHGFALTEVKSGKQVQRIGTAYLNARAQAEASRAHGDARPFLFHAFPPGSRDGLFVIDPSDFEALAYALVELARQRQDRR